MWRSPCTERLRVVWRSVIGAVPFTLGRMTATDVATDVMSWPVRKLGEAAMCAVAVGGVFAGFTTGLVVFTTRRWLEAYAALGEQLVPGQAQPRVRQPPTALDEVPASVATYDVDVIEDLAAGDGHVVDSSR